MFNQFIRKYRRIGSSQVYGFTLLELLISMVVSGIIISGLLYLVVELLQIDRREATLTQTQEDMQRAISYIADDVKEAVFIYPDPRVLLDANGDGTFNDPRIDDLPANSVPVLAFWRPVSLEGSIPSCATWAPGATGADATRYNQCQVLEIRRASYSLVVYLQKGRQSTDTLWKGASRLIRYELDKYDNISNLTLTPGYQDPITAGFANWDSTTTATVGSSSVLVDFVDAPTATTPTTGTNPCTSIGADYTVVPANTLAEQNPSFYGCVKNPAGAAGGAAATAVENNSNQDVYLFLRGNAVDGARGVVGAAGERSRLPTLETRVLMRGVLNKNPE